MLAITKIRRRSFREPCEIPAFQEKEYQKQAEDALEKALDIIQSDGWKKEKIAGDDVIYTKLIPNYGKVFKFVGTLLMSADDVVEHLYFKGEEMHKWNPTVKKVRIVKKIAENLDIAHVIASEGAAGLVSSRDFVNLRIVRKLDTSGYVHGTVGTLHPDVPAISKYVRGEQGPGAYVITSNDEANNCNLQWLLNTNLKMFELFRGYKGGFFGGERDVMGSTGCREATYSAVCCPGWIPQYLIDQTLASVMIDYIQSLRRHNAKIKTGV